MLLLHLFKPIKLLVYLQAMSGYGGGYGGAYGGSYNNSGTTDWWGS